MILLTTSWKLIFASAREDEAPEQPGEGSRETDAQSDCTTAASAEREPQPSLREPSRHQR